MAATTSAGSYAAAVLETAGYVTQAYMLETFREYFQYAGMFLFVCACAGGMLSIAIFGSYKYIRYLLFGPALFFLMTGTTGSTRGAIWRIGDGSPRTLAGPATDEGAAITAVRDTIALNELTNRAADTRREIIPIAFPFAVYTRLVDGFVRSLVNVIVELGDDDYMLFLSRMKAYELLTESEIPDIELIRMFQGDFLQSCDLMFESANAMSSRLVSPELIQNLRTRGTLFGATGPGVNGPGPSGPAAIDAADRAEAQRIFHEQRYARVAREFTTSIGPETRAWLRRNETLRNIAPIIAGRPIEQIGSLRCGEMWEILREAFYQAATSVSTSALRRASAGITLSEKGLYQTELCQALAQKMGRAPLTSVAGSGGSGGTCDLVETAAVYLLRNAITGSGPSEVASRLKNRMQIIRTDKSGTPLPQTGDPLLFKPVVENGGYVSELRNGGAGNQFPARHYKFMNLETNEETWLPAMVNETDIMGDFDAAFIRHQSLQARELRQKIYTFALQMPYYQGMLLFLIAIAYPFLAVILVVPGRAINFIHIPLAWLWVKSWDVGFAFVSVFEKVIWNIFPAAEIEENVGTERALTRSQLPTVIGEAFKIDPLYHVHGYYFFLSTALMAVPVITGMLILRMRGSVFSAFTSSMAKSASAAGNNAGEVYANYLSNSIWAPLDGDLKGGAMFSQSVRMAGMEGGGSGGGSGGGGEVSTEAEALGRMQAVGGMIAKLAGNITSPQKLAGELAAQRVEFNQQALTAGIQMDNSQRKVKESLASIYHPVGGLYGEQRVKAMATNSAADGTQGWNHPDYQVALGTVDAIGKFELQKFMAGEGFLQGAALAGVSKTASLPVMKNLLTLPFGAVMAQEGSDLIFGAGQGDYQTILQRFYNKIDNALSTDERRAAVLNAFERTVEETMESLPQPFGGQVNIIPDQKAPLLPAFPGDPGPKYLAPGKTVVTPPSNNRSTPPKTKE